MKTFRLLALAALLAAPLPVAAQSLLVPGLRVDPVTTQGLTQPISLVFVGPGDALVAEKTGRVKRMRNGVVEQNGVLDLPVFTGADHGLLCLEKHPLFEENRWVYTFHTDLSGTNSNLVTRWTWDGDVLTSATIIATLPWGPGSDHTGGVLRFGPPTLPPAQQKLFIMVGDNRRTGQTENFATGEAPVGVGSVLRLNDDGSVPSGDEKGPFFDVAGDNVFLQALYAYGIRNSFGIAFDPQTGNLWDTENGPSEYDELNLVRPGFNSGWQYVMGPLERSSFYEAPGLVSFGGVGTYRDPAFSWRNPVSPVASYFLGDNVLGARLRGDYLVSTNNTQRIHRFRLNTARDGFVLSGALADTVLDPTDTFDTVNLGTGFPTVTDMRTGPDGALYVVSLRNGSVYRLSRNAAADFEVMHDGQVVRDGDEQPQASLGTDFGVTPTSAPQDLDRTFFLQSVGQQDLELSGTGVSLEGDAAARFSVVSAPTEDVPSGTSAPLTIRFVAPVTPGIYTARVRIATNAPEGDYTFAIKARVQGFGPALRVEGGSGSAEITNGDSTPSVDDGTDFGAVSLVGGAKEGAFTLVNIGDEPLVVSTATLSAAPGFQLVAVPTAVAVGSSATLRVRFQPVVTGLVGAEVRVVSTAVDGAEYRWSVAGTGVLACGDKYGCWLNQLYLEALERAIDEAGTALWTTELCAGRVRLADVAAAVVASPEYLDTAGAVGRAYVGIFNDNATSAPESAGYRVPDVAGWRYWSGVLRAARAAGLAERDARLLVVKGFTGSLEWQERVGNRDNAGFVDFLYRNLLGRFPDDTGRGYWVEQLNAGADRDGLVLDFLDSPEAVAFHGPAVQAAAAFVAVLGRTADAAGYRWFVTTQRVLGLADTLAVLTASDEARQRLLNAGCFYPDDLPAAGR